MGSLKSNKPLRSTKALQAKKPLKPAKVTKKQAQAEISKLKKLADSLFGHYVRLRDAELVGNIQWESQCISCPRVNIVRWFDEDKQKWRWGRKDNIGHFITRTCWFLRYDEMNANGQCVYCNQHLKGNTAAYHLALDEKYGDHTATSLIKLYKENKDYKITKQDLEQVIQASKEYLDWCEEQERQLHEQ